MNGLHVERSQPGAGALPVVMLHGWGMNLAVFDLLRGELAQHETWAIDLPGHGRSPWWPDAAGFEAQREAVLAALPPRCVLAGWSFGAKLAMSIAAEFPRRVAALVLMSATPKFERSPDWPHGMDPGSLRAFRAVLEQDWRRTLSDFVWLQLRGSRDAEESRLVLEQALATHGAPDPEALRAGLELLRQVDVRAAAARIAQPVQIVAGQHDRVTPPGAARWLEANLRNAGLIELPRAGHAPFVSHHAEVGGALRGFLARLPASAAA